MAIIITLESALCFGYCVAFLRGLYGKKNLWWAELLRWYPSLLLFPVLFYYLTEAIFRLPGVDLFSDSLVTCRDSGYRHPIIKPADEVSCTRRRSPVGSSFPCQLIHLYPRTTDHCQWKTTYAATEEALNWKAIILSIGLFVILFLIGFAWNKLKLYFYYNVKN